MNKSKYFECKRIDYINDILTGKRNQSSLAPSKELLANLPNSRTKISLGLPINAMFIRRIQLSDYRLARDFHRCTELELNKKKKHWFSGR